MNILSAFLLVYISYSLIGVFNKSIIFQYFIESILKVSGVPGTIVLMLPLGYTIGLIINLIIHWLGFHFHFPSYSKPVLRTFFEVFGASTIMGFVAYRALSVFDKFFNTNTLLGIFSQGFFSGIIGIISGIIVLYLLGSKELSEVWSTLHKKIWKARAVSPDAEL